MKKIKNVYIAWCLSVAMLSAPVFSVYAEEKTKETEISELQTEPSLVSGPDLNDSVQMGEAAYTGEEKETETNSESAEDSEKQKETDGREAQADTEVNSDKEDTEELSENQGKNGGKAAEADSDIETTADDDTAAEADSDTETTADDDTAAEADSDTETTADDDLGMVEDVELICEKVYLENEKAYARIDFTGDHVIEVSVDEKSQKKGTSLHHVVIPVTLEKETEITVQVEDQDSTYEISFMVIPTLEGFEIMDDEFPEDGDRNLEPDPDTVDDPETESSGEITSEAGNTTTPAEENVNTGTSVANGTSSNSGTSSGNGISSGKGKSSKNSISSGNRMSAENTGSSDSGRSSTSAGSGASATYASSTSSDVVVEYTGRGKSSGSPDKKTKDSRKPGKTEKTERKEKKQGQHIVSKKVKANAQTESAADALADGSYAPTSFHWSGGTGKLKGIECANINITGGEATATLVFASGYYRYVKIGDTIYYPTSQTENTTTFDIPVTLNTNMEIIAMTEAMSQPHEISYTIYIGLNDGSEVPGAELLTESPLGEVVELSNAPKYDGLTYVGSLKTENAELFRIHFYDNDLTILEIDASGTEAEKTKEPETEPSTEEQEAAEDTLYQRETLRYLIIPEDVEIPVGIENECILIQEPVERACVSSRRVQELMEKTGILDQLFAVVQAKDSADMQTNDSVDTPEIKKQIDEETIQSLGAVTELSMKDLLLGKCDLLITDSEAFLSNEESDFFWSGKAEDWISLTEQLQMLKIPLVADRSSEEQTEEAQAEWEKAFLLLFGAEEDDQ